MAGKFDLKNHEDFDGSAQVFKPSNQIKDRGTAVRKAKSISGKWHK